MNFEAPCEINSNWLTDYPVLFLFDRINCNYFSRVFFSFLCLAEWMRIIMNSMFGRSEWEQVSERNTDREKETNIRYFYLHSTPSTASRILIVAAYYNDRHNRKKKQCWSQIVCSFVPWLSDLRFWSRQYVGNVLISKVSLRT